jgi:hypothetical protein
MEYHNNYLEYMVQEVRWYIVSLNRYSEMQELFNYLMYIFFIATKDIFIIFGDIFNTITASYSKDMYFELWKSIEYLLFSSRFEILQTASNWSNRTKKSQDLLFLSHLNNNHPNNQKNRHIHLRPSSVRAKTSDISVNTKKNTNANLFFPIISQFDDTYQKLTLAYKPSKITLSSSRLI